MSKTSLPWPHAPTHQLSESGTYFLTASTYRKAHHFRGAERLRVLHRGLLTLMYKYGWSLEAWAGRRVWFNFRETRITYDKSYLARLNYVHQNAVKHRLVSVANQYPWCSAQWFERASSPPMVTSIYRFKTERLNVPDDFQLTSEW